MKFKAYGWTSLYHSGVPKDYYRSASLDLLPIIRIDRHQYEFPPDESFTTPRKGGALCVLFGWLIFGLTLHFSFGSDE